MIEKNAYLPITGTFVSCLGGDTGINNWGLEEWERDFRLCQLLGIDTVVIICCERESGGICLSGLDPRSASWPEDPNLLAMFFRLADKYGLKLYLGGTENLDNLYKGYWKREVECNRVFYERMLEMFGHHRCFHGLYLSLEALPWHFNFCDIAIGTAHAARKLCPDKKILFSPTLYGLTGYMNGHYPIKDFEKIYGEMLGGMSGALDYCAWQDKYFLPACEMGQINPTSLPDWYQTAKKITEAAGVEFWANIESFQRGSLMPEKREFRQIDYRCLAAKMQAAKNAGAKKAITFEFSTCMDPNAEWGSSAYLLQRYMEMTGISPDIRKKIANGDI